MAGGEAEGGGGVAAAARWQVRGGARGTGAAHETFTANQKKQKEGKKSEKIRSSISIIINESSTMPDISGHAQAKTGIKEL